MDPDVILLDWNLAEDNCTDALRACDEVFPTGFGRRWVFEENEVVKW